MGRLALGLSLISICEVVQLLAHSIFMRFVFILIGKLIIIESFICILLNSWSLPNSKLTALIRSLQLSSRLLIWDETIGVIQVLKIFLKLADENLYVHTVTPHRLI